MTVFPSPGPTGARLVACLLVGFLFLATAAPAAADDAPGKSSLIAVGGVFEDPAIYDEAMRLVGGPDKARVAVLTVTSAPEKARENGQHYVNKFKERGAAHAEWLEVTADRPELAESPAIAARARGANLFVIGGGEQERGHKVLVRSDGSDTRLLAAIRAADASGVATAIVGTSAGAALLTAGPMINGGESGDVLDRPKRIKSLPRGLGFFPWGVIDTHVGERGRELRMLELASRTSDRAPFAFGPDENTGLVVEDARSATPRFGVVGRGGVSIIDLRDARWQRRGGKLRLHNAYAHYLTRGDRFDLSTRSPRFAEWKGPDGRRLPKLSRGDRRDIFGGLDRRDRRPNKGAFQRAAERAFDDPVVGHPRGRPEWLVTLKNAGDGKRVRGSDGTGEVRSYGGLRIDVEHTRKRRPKKTRRRSGRR